MIRSLIKIIILSLVIGALVIGHCSWAQAKEYDGIWFMGFSLKRPPFRNLKVRQATAHAIDLGYIVSEIVSEEVVPGSFIPPGLSGYDSSLKPYKHNPAYAKSLMKKAGYSVNNPSLKNLKMLHTDGVMTIAIADKIKQDLKALGMNVELYKVSYQNEEEWSKELQSGHYDLYLMGYKAGIEQLFSTAEASVEQPDTYSLLAPLFKSDGDANFGGFNSPKVDDLLTQIASLNPAIKGERSLKLKAVNSLLYRELPAVVLFYIEKL